MLDGGQDARSLLLSGVRQGSVLSSVSFNLLRGFDSLTLGATRSMFIGCLMYADDMILICPSVRGLYSLCCMHV